MKATIVSLAVLFLVNLIPALTLGVEQGPPEPAPTAAQPREQYEKSMQERLGRLGCQSALKNDPPSASKNDPPQVTFISCCLSF